VRWKAGLDSHDQLVTHYDLKDDRADRPGFARVEIVPDHDRQYPYLWPEKPWRFVLDEMVEPEWFKHSHEQAAWKAFEEWKAEVYGSFNYQEARNPIKPFQGEPTTPTEEDIALLREWAEVRERMGTPVEWRVSKSVEWRVGESVGESVPRSVGESVHRSVYENVDGSVGESVHRIVCPLMWAYIGSLFPGIQKWKYIDHEEGVYPFQASVDLWRRGLVPSYDGETWRLHSGKKPQIVWEENI